ncbi:MAG TPA: cell division ATP-binding protein FtsE [Amnibacterium sp.]|jgi:cell division transport system ATP-binding protein|nr:cell division ATP-binding protein FtsE [Amnibacterium sp.]
MIRFDSVTKRYRGAPRAALDDVSLEIGSGEFVFLVGASGSGKSSLLRLMLREERPTSGEIHVLGQRLTSISSRKVPYFRRSLGVVFQDFRLLPNKTVFDNVAFTLQVIGKSRGFIHAAVPDVLGMVGLSEKAQNLPTELSGGEQQRVAIARAVVNKPAILLADEPTGNLDPTTSDEIMNVLARINEAGTTVVMATHDVTIVDRMQKRVIELVGGHIIRDEEEATYVTSSIPIQRPQQPPVTEGDTGSVPVWARRGRERPEPPVTTGPTRPAGAPPQAAWQQPPLTAAPAAPRPATGPQPTVQPPTGPSSRAAEEQAEPVRPPVWARPDTGPALTAHGDAERAPWRRPEPAPAPAPRPEADATSLFFAAPLPQEPRADPGLDAEDPRPRFRRRGAASEPETAQDEPIREQGFDARGGVRTITGEIDLDDTGDPEGLARRAGRHRVPPLPDHLDFITGLGLREHTDDDEGVGPSS